MKKSLQSLKTYIYVVFLIAIISLIDAILSLTIELNYVYSLIIQIITLIFFIYNIKIIFKFFSYRLEHITLFLPFYYFITFILFSSLGIYFISKGLVTEYLILTMASISIISALFEIVFARYLLKKFFKSVE